MFIKVQMKVSQGIGGHTFTWIRDDVVRWCIYTSPRPHEFNHKVKGLLSGTTFINNVTADELAPIVAKPSAGTMLITMTSLCRSFLWLLIISNRFFSPKYYSKLLRCGTCCRVTVCNLRHTLRWRHNGRDNVSNTSLTIVYSTVYSDAHQRKHQSSASLAFVWGIHRRPVNSPHKWPVTRKMFPFDDVIMIGMITDTFWSALYLLTPQTPWTHTVIIHRDELSSVTVSNWGYLTKKEKKMS